MGFAFPFCQKIVLAVSHHLSLPSVSHYLSLSPVSLYLSLPPVSHYQGLPRVSLSGPATCFSQSAYRLPPTAFRLSLTIRVCHLFLAICAYHLSLTIWAYHLSLVGCRSQSASTTYYYLAAVLTSVSWDGQIDRHVMIVPVIVLNEHVSHQQPIPHLLIHH